MVANPTLMSPNDPAMMAAEVRALATQAHRSLNDSSFSVSEARDLARRIRRLQSLTRELKSADLADWLSNLRREIDARL
jgi:hypothetical protein